MQKAYKFDIAGRAHATMFDKIHGASRMVRALQQWAEDVDYVVIEQQYAHCTDLNYLVGIPIHMAWPTAKMFFVSSRCVEPYLRHMNAWAGNKKLDSRVLIKELYPSWNVDQHIADAMINLLAMEWIKGVPPRCAPVPDRWLPPSPQAPSSEPGPQHGRFFLPPSAMLPSFLVSTDQPSQEEP